MMIAVALVGAAAQHGRSGGGHWQHAFPPYSVADKL